VQLLLLLLRCATSFAGDALLVIRYVTVILFQCMCVLAELGHVFRNPNSPIAVQYCASVVTAAACDAFRRTYVRGSCIVQAVR
jgi:hypothetical protein